MVPPLDLYNPLAVDIRTNSLLPYNPMSTNWTLDKLDAGPDAIAAAANYAEAVGSFTYSVSADGILIVSYKFRLKNKVNRRQIVLVFDLPCSKNTPTWRRKAPTPSIRMTTSVGPLAAHTPLAAKPVTRTSICAKRPPFSGRIVPQMEEPAIFGRRRRTSVRAKLLIAEGTASGSYRPETSISARGWTATKYVRRSRTSLMLEANDLFVCSPSRGTCH